MKKIIVFLAFVISASAFYAEQPCDVVITAENFQIPCVVTGITDSEVQYKEYPTYDNSHSKSVNLSEIKKLYLSDGTLIDPSKGAVSADIIAKIVARPAPKTIPAPIIKKEVETKPQPSTPPAPVVEETPAKIAETPKPQETHKSKEKISGVTKAETPKTETKAPKSESKPAPTAVSAPTPTQEATPTASNISEPKQPATVPPQPIVQDNLSDEELELKFKIYKSTINKPKTAPQAPQPKPVDLNKMSIAIFVTGLDNKQNDVRKVIESEVKSKLNTIEGNKAKIESAPAGITEDSILSLAKKANSGLTYLIDVMPFQNQYYLQSKLIDTKSGDYLVSDRAVSSLNSLPEVLTAIDELTNQVKSHLQEKKNQAPTSITTSQTQQTQQKSQAKEGTFFLYVKNTMDFPINVLVAGRIIGVVAPFFSQRFKVSTNLYGTVQLIQNSGYKYIPIRETYIIPQQEDGGTVTLEM
ncbi:MAG: hypothetical protein K6F10_04810 [Paludibacteraceae bacterium]|nr:hypothetical protein [Paludibacteraceae bacterium]